MGSDRRRELPGISVSRRRLLHAAGSATLVSVAGCLSGDRCDVLYNRVDAVPETGNLTELVAMRQSDRIYIKSITQRGTSPKVTVTAPDETVLRQTGPEPYIELVYEAVSDTPVQITFENRDSLQTGVWQTTIIRYKGWCPEVY